MKRLRQSGMTTLEFAIGGAALLMVLIACLEIARMLYVWNTLGESTRRAARIAAVCPVNHPSIVQAALLRAPGQGGDGRFIKSLSAANVGIDYLSAAGAATGIFDQIRYVRVSITGFQHRLMIPLLARTIDVPPFATTLPIESLGYSPEARVRQCPGA